MVNRIFFTGNAQGNVTNLAGGAAITTHLDYLPIYTSDGSATGNVGVGVVLLGSGGGTTSLGTVTNIPKGAANFATTQVSIPTTAGGTLIIAARATRRAATITNASATGTLYVGVNGLTASNGFPLAPLQSIPIDTTAAIYGIGSATVTAAAVESYDT